MSTVRSTPAKYSCSSTVDNQTPGISNACLVFRQPKSSFWLMYGIEGYDGYENVRLKIGVPHPILVPLFSFGGAHHHHQNLEQRFAVFALFAPLGIVWSKKNPSSGKPSPSLTQKREKVMASLGVLPVKNQDQVPLLRKLLGSMVKPYLKKNPTVSAALELIRQQDQGPICYDHFAFRTFGADGCGIDAVAQVFLDLGYSTRDELRFPSKKLRALWFSPPEHTYDVEGELENGPLPRIFISEILVDQLSEESQQVIHKYIKVGGPLAKYAPFVSSLDTLSWATPSLADYQQLARESEYAAWLLVHGYALNHAAISVHRLHQMRSIDQLNQFLQQQSIKLNSEGGILKVSPDGLLQQSSSVADSLEYVFADSEVRRVPASYIEFAERLVLPVYSNLKDDEILEQHRREGFEVGNAEKILASTSSEQTGIRRV